MFPEIWDRETEEDVERMMDEFIKKMGFIDVREQKDIEPGEIEYDADLLRAKATAAYQFGKESADALFKGEIELIKSRKTGKIRNVISDGEHVLSLRAPRWTLYSETRRCAETSQDIAFTEDEMRLHG